MNEQELRHLNMLAEGFTEEQIEYLEQLDMRVMDSYNISLMDAAMAVRRSLRQSLKTVIDTFSEALMTFGAFDKWERKERRKRFFDTGKHVRHRRKGKRNVSK